MNHRLTIAFLLLLAVITQAGAQALSGRYKKNRPVVIACDHDLPPYSFIDEKGQPTGLHVDIVRSIIEELDVPCRFMAEERSAARKDFEQGRADMILTDASDDQLRGYYHTKAVIHYLRVNADSIAEMRLASRDRQLVEQMDGVYTRLKHNGTITAVQDRWLHPERVESASAPALRIITDGALTAAAVVCLLCLLLWLCTKYHDSQKMLRSRIVGQAEQTGLHYAAEDNEASHDLQHRYEAILDNPFVAISFYDNKGHVIIENDTMKRLGHAAAAQAHRMPIYNLQGEIANYLTAINCSEEVI